MCKNFFVTPNVLFGLREPFFFRLNKKYYEIIFHSILSV